MGMGQTASGPTGSPDEYVVTYCRVRAPARPSATATRTPPPPSVLLRGSSSQIRRAAASSRRSTALVLTRRFLSFPPVSSARIELRRWAAGVQRGQVRHPERPRGREGGAEPRGRVPDHGDRVEGRQEHLERAPARLVRKERPPGAARDRRRPEEGVEDAIAPRGAPRRSLATLASAPPPPPNPRHRARE